MKVNDKIVAVIVEVMVGEMDKNKAIMGQLRDNS